MGSDNPFPPEGLNREVHMKMMKGWCLGDGNVFPFFGPDPGWDMRYMRGALNWLLLLCGRQCLHQRILAREKGGRIKRWVK